MFGFEQPVMAPIPKRRRGLGRSNCHNAGYMPSTSLTSLRYTVDESPDGYTLLLSKKVPKGMISEAVNQQIAELKEELYRPTYHLVRDLWGNPYFVEEEADEESLLRSALSRLDMPAISRKIARSLFQEYEIDLNHRGDQLTVSSRKDGITKSFEIGSCIEDIRVAGCKLDESQEFGVLKIELMKSDESKGQSNDFAKLIQWSQSKASEQREEEEKAEESRKAAEKAQAKREARAKAKAEAQLKAELEAEAQAEAQREAEAKREFEAQLRARFEAEALARKKEAQREELEAKKQQELKRRIAREEEEKRMRELARLEEEERSFHKQQLKEKKAFLVEQKRAKRLRAEQKKASQSPKTVTININFGNEQEDEEHSLKRYQSPVLEDVDDEETRRFNESLSRSPRGSSILEDV